MKCPNCGSLEKARVRVCPDCGTVYASQDLLELRQLEYLLDKTASWPGVEALRQSYTEQLEALRSRLLGPKTTAPQLEQAPQRAGQMPAAEPIPPEVIPVRPRREALPFDQWLLSERNIKFALYSGGLLLVIAGLIFIGVNWRWLSGPVKLAITVSITGLMYLGGYLLYRRSFLRLGGVALLAVACGFFPLNFVVLQVYISGPQGMDNHFMWLVGSLSALLLYFLTAYWTRADLFTYFSLAAFASAVTAGMVLLNLPLAAYPLIYAVLALALLLIARGLRSAAVSDFIYLPLLVATQLTIPVLFVSGLALWVAIGMDVEAGSPWLALAAMGVCALFYVATDLAFGWIIARWAAAGAFGLTFVLVLAELDLSPTINGSILITLALAYLLLGYALQSRSGRPMHGWPLYVTGYALAAFLTLQGLAFLDSSPERFAQILLGDVLLLAASAWLYRRYAWVYGAAWLLPAPVAIYADLYTSSRTGTGLALSVLMVLYVVAGYLLGRRALRFSGPFLSAAAFLSMVVVPLVWADPTIASIILVLLAVLYLLVALWLRLNWLLLPALVAMHLAVITILNISFTARSPWQQALTIVYAVLGVALTLAGYWLQRLGKLRWAWPLLMFAVLDVAATYLSGLIMAGWMAIALSAAYAALAFWLAWAEREAGFVSRLTPIFSYLGAALVFIGHFYVVAFAEMGSIYWPLYTAGLCALLVALSWLARRGEPGRIFGRPLHRSGVLLMFVPLLGAVVMSSQWLWISFSAPGSEVVIPSAILPVITYAIAGVTYIADAAIRRSWMLGYMGGSAFIVVIWYALSYFGIEELQAFVLPLGLGFLLMGWNEQRLVRPISYRSATFSGLLVLMGSAFYQSLSASLYAALLLVESLLALGWGIRTHSRIYVQVAGLALLANAVAQLGPAFIELPRWVEVGIIGSLLLGGGLLALFRRERIVAARKNLSEEWKKWQL